MPEQDLPGRRKTGAAAADEGPTQAATPSRLRLLIAQITSG